jgi:CHAT domain
MLVTVKVKTDPWQVEIHIPGANPADVPRPLRKGVKGMPLPPTEESAAWSDKSAGLCSASGDDDSAALAAYKLIVAGDTSGDTVVAFGGYLQAVLLGRAWKIIADLKQSPVELELHFDPVDVTMQRLPWEMMIDGEEPLGVAKGIVVSVARIVDKLEPKTGAAGANEKVEESKTTPVEIPLRILFVIGYMSGQSLRPGAEVLAIRQLNATPPPPVPGQDVKPAEYVDIDLRVLQQGTLTELKAAIEEFAPAVVHVVAHGRWEDKESRILLTEKTETNGEISAKELPCSPQTLIANVRRNNGDLPHVVVLNACHTGETAFSDAYLPFAAQLVRMGVPIALGMAGEVADLACRIFSRALYQSILDLKSLPVAAAYGRRAAIAAYNRDYRRNVEWSRLTVFRRENAAATVAADRVRQSVAAAAYVYRKPYGQATLCDRLDPIRAYQQYRGVVAGAPCQTALAFEVTVDESDIGGKEKQTDKRLQIGKSHLLVEIAAQALFDGMIPCIAPSGQGYPPPSNLLGFAIRFGEITDDTRRAFKMDRRNDSEGLRLAFDIFKEPFPEGPWEQPAAIRAYKRKRDEIKERAEAMGPDGQNPKVKPDRIVDAIQADAEALIANVETYLKPAGGPGPAFWAVLILLDDLHAYEGCATGILDLMVRAGLAGVKGRLGMAFTYSTKQHAGPDILKFMTDFRGAFVRQPLGPFQTPHESRMAYSQFLLSRKPALAPTWRRSEDDRQRVEAAYLALHEKIHGVPSYFDQAEEVIKLSVAFGVLVPADDETILRTQWNGK